MTTIDLKSTERFLIGPNIHFLYQVENNALLYLHPDFNWLTSPDQENLEHEIRSKIHPDDWFELITAFKKTLEGEFDGILTVRFNTASGKRWLQICPFLAYQESSKLIMGSLFDVTDEVLNQETVHRYADKKNSILHMLAHDLRGPLNIAKSVTKIIDSEVAEPGLRRKTAYIAGILQQAIDLITDLVTREFLETAEVVLVKKRVDIVKKLHDYLEECKRSEELAQRTFQLKCSHEQILIELDDAKFMQVINNLVSNALKFTHPGGSISIEVTAEKDNIKFAVSDDGIGIPKEQLGLIFEKFTIARRRGLNGEPTLGLGLSIVATIVGWHGGNIWCESIEGKGSTFYLSIPKT